MDGSQNSMWVVFIPASYNQIKTTHAGGREIQIVPRLERPNPMRNLYARLDLIGRRINPRRMLTPPDLTAIRIMFPTSVGIRILIAGRAIVLFDSNASKYASWKEGLAYGIGKLYVDYDVLDHHPTTATTLIGSAVAEKPEKWIAQAAIGLRLKLANGTEAITTVTHGFVELAGWNPMFLRVADWILKAKEALSNFRPWKRTVTQQAEITMKGIATGNSPLGREIWLAGSNQRVR